MPPITNGNKSKITLDTKNILIEITATDLTKADMALDILVTMFSQYCAKPYCNVTEVFNVITPEGKVLKYPSLKYRNVTICKEEVNQKIGIVPALKSSEIVSLLNKMSLSSKQSIENDGVIVSVGPTR